MKASQLSTTRSRGVVAAAILAVMVLGLLLAACGDATPTPQVLVVTATFTPKALVQVVTATLAPTSAELVMTATSTPMPEVVASDTPVPQPSDTSIPQPSDTPRPTPQQPVQPASTATRTLLRPTQEVTEPVEYYAYKHPSGAFSLDIPWTSDWSDREDGLYFVYADSLVMIYYTVLDAPLTTAEMEALVPTLIDETLVGEELIWSYDDLYVQTNETGDAVASAFTITSETFGDGDGSLILVQTGRTIYTMFLLTPDYAAVEDVWETATSTLSVFPMETAVAATATPMLPTAAPVPPTAKPPTLRSYFVVYTAYQGPDLQDYSLWGMNGDGSGAFKVEGAGQASEPAFSPDGKKFAFYHWTDGLYVWDLLKETSTRIVDNSEASFPTWAPNGQRLAYANLYGQPWIHIVNSDRSGDRGLTPGLRPSWSLTGEFIAYDTCENNQCGIFRIKPDGSEKRQLSSDGGGGAAVSPDGKKIAYWSRADGDFEIYVVNSDGSGKKQLTQNTGNDALPAWSPDGKYIYYLSDQNGKGWAVMIMNANGSDQRKVIKTNAGSDPVRGWQYQRITVTWND